MSPANDRGGRVHLRAIEEPPLAFGTPLEVFQASLDHERLITASIEALYESGDRSTQAFLDWFLTEQVEEEKTCREVVTKLRMVKDDPASLLEIDRELGGRTEADADGGRN